MRLDEGQIEVVDPVTAGVLRAMSGPQRLRMAHYMWVLTRDRLTAYLRYTRPEWDEARIRREVARRLSGGTG